MLTARQISDNIAFPFTHYLFDPSRGLVCCAIPKNGCTAIKSWFLRLVEPDLLENHGIEVHAHCRGHHTLCSRPPDVIAEALATGFTFAFIRDPLARVASAYVEKFIHPGPLRIFDPAREVIDELSRSMPVDLARGITFREFVEFLCSTPDEHLESHWRPQSSFICGNRFDLLARVEELTETLVSLNRALDIPGEARLSGHRNAVGYTTPTGVLRADIPSGPLYEAGLLPPAEDLYDPALRERILQRFRADADLYRAARPDAPGLMSRELFGKLNVPGPATTPHLLRSRSQVQPASLTMIP